MDYLPIPNLLLEALAYLGRKAGGYTGQYMAEHLKQRGVQDLDGFWTRFSPIDQIFTYLDDSVSTPPQALDRFFNSLPGFSHSTIGAYSPAFLLFYPVLSRYDGSLSSLLEQAHALSPNHAAYHLLMSLGLCDSAESPGEDSEGKLIDGIRALEIPSDSKLVLLDVFHRRDSYLDEAAFYLAPVLDALSRQREELEAIARSFGDVVNAPDPESYLCQTSSLSLSSNTVYHIRPFIFGLDTNLSVNPGLQLGQGEVLLYSGVMRRFLLDQLFRLEDEASEIFNAIKVLGDRTRFDIMCFLRDHPAYGQELSNHFGLARNTIHHHMSKLSNVGLISCTVDGNRVYYSVDKAAVDHLLAHQRYLLLGNYSTTDYLR